MAKYLARSCPRCSGYLGIVMREPKRNAPLQAINGRCLQCGYRLAWILVQGRKVALRVVTPRRSLHLDFWCCGLAGKAARNAPKCHYSRLYRAGVFVSVVAQPIQDMSAVSVTYKTVGNRLPRLRCGAIGWRTKRQIKSHQAATRSKKSFS